MYLLAILRTRAFQREERNLALFLSATADKWVHSSYEVSCDTLLLQQDKYSLVPSLAGRSSVCSSGVPVLTNTDSMEGE